MKSVLTVVTPTLNCGDTLQDTLNSLHLFKKGFIQHIVVDSGSEDNTRLLAESSGSTILDCPRGNMYEAVNRGMNHSDSEWLTYINGDDVLFHDAVMDMLHEADEATDVIYGNIDYIDKAGRFLFSWRSPTEAWLKTTMSAYSSVPQQGTLFRRRVFDRLKGFDTQFRYSADYDFWVRALLKGFKFKKYSTKSVAGFRLLAEQLSHSQKDSMAPEGISIRDGIDVNRSSVRRQCMRVLASVYRNATNIDSHLLRALRGRGLDQRS